MEKEIKFVTRTETFNDLAVKELGKGKAACVCRLQFKRCDKSACASCPQNQKYKNCVSQMSDYDKLRLDTYVSEYYVRYSRWPDQWMSHKRYVSH